MAKHIDQDAKLVAEKQKHEMKYICEVFSKDNQKLRIPVLRAVMTYLGKNSKPCRSRRRIYGALREQGYVYSRKKAK